MGILGMLLMSLGVNAAMRSEETRSTLGEIAYVLFLTGAGFFFVLGMIAIWFFFGTLGVLVYITILVTAIMGLKYCIELLMEY